MKNFKIRLLDAKTGNLLEQLLSARTEDEARNQIRASGLHVLSISRQRQSWTWSGNKSFVAQYAMMCRELRTLMVAGMGVVEAIDTLCEFDTGGQKSIIQLGASLAQQLRDRLREGQSLSNALAELPSVPPVLLACVRSVEHTSNLLEALDDYLRYHDMMALLRSKVVSAAIYPAIVSLLGIGVSVFLLMVVMPQFAHMYSQLRGNAQGITYLVIFLSQQLAEHLLLFLCIFASMLVTVFYWIASGRAIKKIGRWGWRVRWVKQFIMDYQLALFYQTLHLLSKGGYALVPALHIARTAAVSKLLNDQVHRCQIDIEHGRSVSASLYQAGLANEVDRRLLAAAEDNGEFFRVSSAIALLHRTRFELLVERFTRIVEPALLMAVALLVGTVVVVMYMPVFEMGAMAR